MATKCPLTLTGLGRNCDSNIGGIVRAWFGQWSEFNIAVNEETHEISGITAASGATDAKFYEYEFARQTGSLNSEYTNDPATGVRYYTNTANLQFSRMESNKHVELEALAKGDLIGIFEDGNGNMWLAGKDNPLTASAQTAGTGQSFSDLNGYTTSMSAMSGHLPYKVLKSQFESFIG